MRSAIELGNLSIESLISSLVGSVSSPSRGTGRVPLRDASFPHPIRLSDDSADSPVCARFALSHCGRRRTTLLKLRLATAGIHELNRKLTVGFVGVPFVARRASTVANNSGCGDDGFLAMDGVGGLRTALTASRGRLVALAPRNHERGVHLRWGSRRRWRRPLRYPGVRPRHHVHVGVGKETSFRCIKQVRLITYQRSWILPLVRSSVVTYPVSRKQ
jgi:hypothetical protein